jgi:hypothetical protein
MTTFNAEEDEGLSYLSLDNGLCKIGAHVIFVCCYEACDYATEAKTLGPSISQIDRTLGTLMIIFRSPPRGQLALMGQVREPHAYEHS